MRIMASALRRRSRHRCHVALLVAANFFGAWANDIPPDAQPSMKFSINPLTEEQQSSQVIPDEFRCDACKATLHKISKGLSKLQPKDIAEVKKKNGQGAAAEQAALLTEALEAVCVQKTFDDYAMKDMGDTRLLHGPGIKKEGPGVIQGGGLWPKRLGSRCSALVEEIGEVELAKNWRAGPDKLAEICAEDCGTGIKKERKRKKPSPPPSGSKESAAEPAPRSSSPKPRATGLEELPAPPHKSVQLERANITSVLSKKKRKFQLVVFYDGTPRSAHAVLMGELAARELAKSKEKALRDVIIGRYDSSSGDTFGYTLKHFPKALFYRKGYINPKAYDGDMNGPNQMVDWIKNEVKNVYLKDDPEKYPRGDRDWGGQQPPPRDLERIEL